MPLHLTIENETSLPDGGPLSVTVTSQRGIDIGRDQYLDWVLPDPTRFISGKHCEIRYSDGQYWLRDVSTNGTFVNRNEFRIDGAHALRDGDRLEIGRYIINVRVEPDGADAYGDAASGGGGGAIWDIGGDAPPPINPNELRPQRAAANGPDFLDWAADLGSAPPPMMPPPQPYPVQAPPPAYSPPPAPPPPMAEPAGWAMPAPTRPAAAPAPAGVWSLDPVPALDSPPPLDPLPPPPPGYEPALRPAAQPVAQPVAQPEAPSAMPAAPPVDFGPAPPPGSRADAEPGFAPVAPFPAPASAPFAAAEGTIPPPEPMAAPAPFAAPPAAAPVFTAPPQAAPPPAPAPAAPVSPAPVPPAPMHPALPRATGLPDAGAEFIARFARSAGLPEDLVRSRDAGALADLLGLFVRLTADNLRQLHAARAQSKGAMRSANVTMIQLMDNNPLRFSPTTDDALRILFGPPTKSYLDAPRTLDNSFADLKKHQLQVFSAMQTALRQLLADLDPKSVESSVPADKGVGALLRSREARLWEHYQTMWKARAGTSEHGMLDVFMRLFADAYDKA